MKIILDGSSSSRLLRKKFN